MPFVVAAPEMTASAALDLAGIRSMISEANAAAAASTTAVTAAARDEVSAAIASLFSGHGQQFQALSAQATAFHAEFVRALNGAGSAYAAVEAGNVSPLQAVQQDALAAVNKPTQVLVGRPLVGNGANGAAGTGQAGGDGGILWGNGGNGGSGASGQTGGKGGDAGLFGNGGNGGAGGAGTTGLAGANGGSGGPVGWRCRREVIRQRRCRWPRWPGR